MKKISFVLFFLFICNYSILAFETSYNVDINPYLEKRSSNIYSETQMLDYNVRTMNLLDSKYDKLCQKIIENFEEDKLFVEAFKKDIKAFKEYRKTQDQIAHPRFETDTISYGTMYFHTKWLNDYSLTVLQIERTYKNILAYCEHNQVFLNNSAVCSEENIESLFDGIKN